MNTSGRAIGTATRGRGFRGERAATSRGRRVGRGESSTSTRREGRGTEWLLFGENPRSNAVQDEFQNSQGAPGDED